MPDDDLIPRAENTLEGITDGPWVVDVHPYHDLDEYQIDYPETVTAEDLANAERFYFDGPQGDVVGECHKLPNAQFTAAARTLVPELVAALKTAQAELERVRALGERYARSKTWDGKEALAEQGLGREILSAISAEGVK